jgi:dephospho-CoA kinase
MIVLGLTGSIAMGKSTVASMFATLGLPVFDADAVVREFYSGDLAKRVEEMFPGVLVKETVDRERLSQMILLDETALKRLQGVIHPAVAKARKEFVYNARLARRQLVVLDIPLLFETGGEAEVDIVVVVSAPEEIQRARALARKGMTEDKLANLLSRQTTDFEKRRQSHFVIDTSESLDKTDAQVRQLLRCVAGLRGRDDHHA